MASDQTIETTSARAASGLAALLRSPALATTLGALYPIVFLWTANLDDQIPRNEVLTATAWSVGISLLVFAGLRLILGDGVRAGLLTLLLQLLIFSFGHVAVEVFAIVSARESAFLLYVYGVIGLVGAWLIVWRGRGASGAVSLINLILIGLLVFNLAIVARGGVDLSTGGGPSAALTETASTLGLEAGEEPRDVYYLIFDRYAGEETLANLYDFENTAFLSALEDRGFQVTYDAIANYTQTAHSLASSLNMTYLDGLAATVGEGSDDWTPIYRSLEGSTVPRLFQEMGYSYEYAGSWWTPTSDDPTADGRHREGASDEFTRVLLDTTAIPAIGERVGLAEPEEFEKFHFDLAHFQRDAVLDVAEDPDPTFMFVHFLMPHTPYVMDEDGDYRPWTSAPITRAYVDQLQGTNLMILDLVDRLLAGPDETDPIVILQSDEGPHPPIHDVGEDLLWPWGEQNDTELGRKLRILQAAYLPDAPAGTHLTVTPVNTFRVIFDSYYGGSLPLLEDRTYVFSERTRPFDLIDVTDRVASG